MGHPVLHLPVFEQLKQRNVFRVAVLYVVVCWLILDPVHVIFHMAGVPEWANRLVLIVMALGFPAAVIFAWVYESTPEGLKPTVEVPHGQSIRKVTARRLDRAIIAVLAVALAYFVVDKFWISKQLSGSQPAATAAESQPANAASRAAPSSAAAFNPPPHSIAVLPFINLSGDQAQEYFSDGLTEELLNSLAAINGLQVAARTSAFSFKGTDNDIGTIARKLNVAAILEGSVRRSARTVRVTAQLINAVTGFHLWSKTYDHDLGDVLVLQTEIANAVAGAMKVTLFGDEAAKIELGGTRNPAAFDAYVRASKLYGSYHEAQEMRGAIGAFSDAIRLDPNYALAFAGRSRAHSAFGIEHATGAAIYEEFAKAESDARRATALAPELADAHLALADSSQNGPAADYTHALQEYERAMALAPGDARVLQFYGAFAALMGRSDAGIAATRRAVVLDPLNPRSYFRLGEALYYARRYEESVRAYDQFISLDPESPHAYAFRGLNYYVLGNFEAARASCEIKTGQWNQQCLALTYDRLGRHADAEAQLAKITAAFADAGAYQYGEVYTQWGNTAKALDWLETALRLRDPGLVELKLDPLLDPLRKERRFQAIERELRFPN